MVMVTLLSGIQARTQEYASRQGRVICFITSVLQRNEYKDGKVFPKHSLIRPVYPHPVELQQLKSLSFTTKADFYVHYFVLHPTPIEGRRFGMCIVGDHTSDKVSIDRTVNRLRFHVNTAFLNEKFREAICLMA
jgi:hypothetical protein